jgi:hypothetical protein
MVLAVTVPWQNGRVDMIQSTIQPTRADLPMPWPLEMASRMGATGIDPSNPRLLTSSPSSIRLSRCQPSGSSRSRRPGSCQGYMASTNPSGSA